MHSRKSECIPDTQKIRLARAMAGHEAPGGYCRLYIICSIGTVAKMDNSRKLPATGGRGGGGGGSVGVVNCLFSIK
jgi:hypothetical protein